MKISRYLRRSVCVAALFTMNVWAQAALAASPSAPGPDLSPTQVVSAQLAALRDPDRQAGITRAWRFASPENQAMIGSVYAFGRMLDQQYDDMLSQTDARVTLDSISGDQARVIAELTQPSGLQTAYLFLLSRQHGGDCDGCWRTDGVVKLKPANGSPMYSI